MSNTTLHWRLRESMHHLREGARLAVLMCYVLHANERNRAWPSVETLMVETGYGKTAVVAAKAWLVEHEALEHVAPDKRLGDEAKLHHRIDVMQVTGALIVDGQRLPILSFNSRTNEPVYSSPGEPKRADSSPREPNNGSPGEPEDITNKEDSKDSKKSLPAPQRERPPDPMFDALVEVCRLNPKLSGSYVARTKKELVAMGKTPEDVKAFGVWWYVHDWRGQKNQAPTLNQVATMIEQPAIQPALPAHPDKRRADPDYDAKLAAWRAQQTQPPSQETDHADSETR